MELGAGQCPDWHENPFTGGRSRYAGRPWWAIPDFDPELGDIKTVWEASRWDWVVHFAQDARDGNPAAIGRLNDWLADWWRANPPYCGVNWECGQEASLRVMHLALAAVILEQFRDPLPGLMAMVRIHLQRIAPTIRYAVGQDNNHGTSEAAALFIGGTWLERVVADKRAVRWAAAGRRWLEDRVARLVAADGSFSQYSVNYHRVLVDTLTMVERWRRRLELPAFSSRFQERARAAVAWLKAFTDPASGDAPNLGANDGARFLPLRRTGYRDYRPSVQLGAALFGGRTVYPEGPWDEAFQGLAKPERGGKDTEPSRLFDDGGYAVLRRGGARVYVRYPRFRFRPSQADALHVDLWVGSRNVLRDGGSFSYADAEWAAYFNGTASHNTLQFDGRDQMPRLGRFLFGEWLKCRDEPRLEEAGEAVRFSVGYRDWKGAWHERAVELSAGRLRVRDQAGGFRQSAVLRWRLKPGEWRLAEDGVSGPGMRLRVSARAGLIKRMELVTGQESRFYLKREEIPVLEVEMAEAGEVETVVEW